jgi:hypothetical protein
MIACAFFALFLWLGLSAFRDFGISWDEGLCRERVGIPNYLFLAHWDKQALKKSDTAYGPAFDTLLVLVEKAMQLEDMRTIFLVRHLVNFLWFFAAVVVFYRLLMRRFESQFIGLAGALFLILSPRIFAEAFYNCKDMACLPCMIFALATLDRFLCDMSGFNAVLHGATCGLLIDVRLPTMIVPMISMFLAVIVCWARAPRPRLLAVLRCFPLWIYVASFCFFLILFWPVLWLNPTHWLYHAWVVMKHYPHVAPMLYLGGTVDETCLPWHYIPVWMLITTPLFYTALFIIGAGQMLVDCIRHPIRLLVERPTDAAMVLVFLLPPAAVIALRAAVYDSWRHLYFIYPAFVFIGVLGFATLYRGACRLARRVPVAVPIFLIGMTIPLVWIAVAMARCHPHEYLYFNRLAGRDLHEVERRFELDYWGLSCRDGLEYLVEHDPSPLIRIYCDTEPARVNSYLLPPSQRARLRYNCRKDEADYQITHFRWCKDKLPADEVFYALRLGGADIMAVRRLRHVHDDN